MAKSQDNGDKYEKDILEKIQYELGTEEFDYGLKVLEQGPYSGLEWDIVIIRKNEKKPFWIIECKCWNPNTMKKFLNVVREHIGKKWEKEVMGTYPELFTFIVANPPNISSTKLATEHNFKIEVISKKEAEDRSWLKLAHDIYPYDACFHPEILGVKKLLELNKPIDAINRLEGVFYEEWLAVIDYSFDKYPAATEKLLKLAAEYHYDDGWRYNAIQKLDEYGCLDENFIAILLSKEEDQYTRKLLLNKN